MYNVYHKLQNMKLSMSIQNIFSTNNIHNKQSVSYSKLSTCLERQIVFHVASEWKVEHCVSKFSDYIMNVFNLNRQDSITTDFYRVSRIDKMYSNFMQICINCRGLIRHFFRVMIKFHTTVTEHCSMWFSVLKKRNQ